MEGCEGCLASTTGSCKTRDLHVWGSVGHRLSLIVPKPESGVVAIWILEFDYQRFSTVVRYRAARGGSPNRYVGYAADSKIHRRS